MEGHRLMPETPLEKPLLSGQQIEDNLSERSKLLAAWRFIPFILQVAWVLAAAALFHPGHIVDYAFRDYEPHK
jgi:hypothetical protein